MGAKKPPKKWRHVNPIFTMVIKLRNPSGQWIRGNILSVDVYKVQEYYAKVVVLLKVQHKVA